MSIVKSLTALAVITIVIWAILERSSSVVEHPSGHSRAVVRTIEEPTPGTPSNKRQSAASDELVSSQTANAGIDDPVGFRFSAERAASQPAVEQSSTRRVGAERPESAQQVRSAVALWRTPFPVSPSVAEHCLEYGDLRSPTMPEQPAWEYEDKCLTVRRALTTFIEEDRLEPWASETEALFKRSFEIDPHRCEVRNLECRSTLCGYECTYLGDFNIAAQTGYVEKYGLGHYSDVHGFERDESRNLIVVRLAVFARE